MKTISVALCGVLFWVGDAVAAAPDCSSTPLMSIENAQGAQALYVPAERIAKTPQWSPALGAPPLAMEKLVELLEKWSATKNPEYERVVVEAISLRSYHCPDVVARWFYTVDYVPVSGGEKKMEKFSTVAILFDGSVIGLTPKK